MNGSKHLLTFYYNIILLFGKGIFNFGLTFIKPISYVYHVEMGFHISCELLFISAARLAARHIICDAVDIGGALGGEVDDEIGDLGELAAASERGGLRACVSLAQVIDGDAARVGKRLLIGEGTKPCRLEDAGRDADDTHAVLTELLRPRAREGVDGVLGRCVDALSLGALDAALGTHVDEHAVSLCDELSPDCLRAEVDALEVDRRDLVKDGIIQLIFPMRILRIDKEARDVDAGVVDEDVDSAEFLLRCRNHRLNARTLRDIGDNVEHLAALLIECRSLGVHITDDNIRPLCQKLLDDRFADARRSARDNGSFSFEIQPTHNRFSFVLSGKYISSRKVLRLQSMR